MAKLLYAAISFTAGFFAAKTIKSIVRNRAERRKEKSSQLDQTERLFLMQDANELISQKRYIEAIGYLRLIVDARLSRILIKNSVISPEQTISLDSLSALNYADQRGYLENVPAEVKTGLSKYFSLFKFHLGLYDDAQTKEFYRLVQSFLETAKSY
jgi:hypothetical protein